MVAEARRLGLGVMVGNMVGTSLAMAPAWILGQLCDIIDLDGTLFLTRDRTPGDGFRERQGLLSRIGLGRRGLTRDFRVELTILRSGLIISGRDNFSERGGMAQSREGRVSRRRVLQGAALRHRSPRCSTSRRSASSPTAPHAYSARAIKIVERSLVIDMLARAQDRLQAGGLRGSAHRGRGRDVRDLRHHRLSQLHRHRRARRPSRRR